MVGCLGHLRAVPFLWFAWRTLDSAARRRGLPLLDEADRIKARLAPKAMKVVAVGTLKTRQGKGDGSRAMRAVQESARSRGEDLYLESSNPRNLPFYHRLGFTTVEEWFPFERDPEVEGKGPIITLMVWKCDAPPS